MKKVHIALLGLAILLCTALFATTTLNLDLRSFLSQAKPQPKRYCISAESKNILIDQGISPEGLSAFIKSFPEKQCPTHFRHIFVDFNKSNLKPRLFVFDIRENHTGVIYKAQVAHGVKSGSRKYASRFSNIVGSNQSSLGIYKILSKVKRTTAPFSFPLKGLDKTLNSHAFKRNITIHQAKYVKSSYVGRSEGCFAISMKSIKQLDALNVENGYLFAYHKSLQHTARSF